MERLGLVLLLAQLAALAAYAHANTAVVSLHRRRSSLDPNGQRSNQNVVCELHCASPCKQHFPAELTQEYYAIILHVVYDGCSACFILVGRSWIASDAHDAPEPQS